MQFEYRFDNDVRGHITPLNLATVVSALNVGETITITRLPDVVHVKVRIVTKNGMLTKHAYTYRHTSALAPGTLVEIPAQRWMIGQPSHGIVQTDDAPGVEDHPVTESIIRVL